MRQGDEKTFESEPNYIVVRVTDGFLGFEDLIKSHNEVASRFGSVLFGKLGKPIAHPRVSALNECINEGAKAYLVLIVTQRDSKQKPLSRNLFKGTLLRISREDLSDEGNVPDAYQELGVVDYVETWFEVDQLHEDRHSELNSLVVSSSGQSLDQALGNSMSSLFFCRSSRSL